MKLKTTLFALLTLTSFARFASAVDVEGSAIRMTVNEDVAQEIGLRYSTQNDQVDTQFSGGNTFVFNSFDVDNDILWPTEHSITVYMNGDILTLSFDGNNDDNAERMYVKALGVTEYLYLNSEVEIAPGGESKVEILDANNEPVQEVTQETIHFLSNHEFEVRIEVLPILEGQPADQGNDQDNGAPDAQDDGLGNEAAASGGCSMAGSAPLASGLWAVFGLALSGLGFLRRKLK